MPAGLGHVSPMQALWMVVASFLFACMGVCVKLAADSFSTAEIVFYRNAISLLLIAALVGVRRVPLRTPHWRFQLWRGASGFVSLCFYFYGISLLPLATAVTLAYTAPLFLALYLAAFGKARLNVGIVAALGVGFAGVALLLRPNLDGAQWLGITVSLVSGMLAGIAYFNVRELGERGEPEERTVFYFSLGTTLVGLVGTLVFGGFTPLHWQTAWLLPATGILASLGQLCLTRAYTRGSTLVVATLQYLGLVYASLFSILLFKEHLHPWAWWGMGIIVLSGVAATWLRQHGSGAAAHRTS